MAELKYLQIGFENCEVITLPANEIASLDIENITKTLAKDWYTNMIIQKTKASDIVLILLPDANHFYARLAKDNKTVFDRIRERDDVTDITFIYVTAESESIVVKWDDKDDYSNKNQTTAVLSDGSLVVAIGEKVNALDIKKEIDTKIKQIDKYDESFKESISKSVGRWVKVRYVVTGGGDPCYVCSNCGQDEHVYGIEHHDKHKECRNCGCRNFYPWEKVDKEYT